MSDRLLEYAQELEAQDAALADAIAETESLRGAALDLHDRAARVQAFLAGLPAERAAAADAADRAGEELDERRAAARAAEAELERAERAGKEEQVLAARRAVVRTRDAAATAERKLERAREAAEALEREAAASDEEIPRLEGLAGELAARLAAIPRAATGPPAPGIAGAVDWAARAASALFVARSGLESERERVIRQANELGQVALGEPLVVTSVSLVRERIQNSRR